MKNIKSCRVCFKTEGKLFDLQQNTLYCQLYEQMTGKKIDYVDLASIICYTCVCLMKKYIYFKNMCKNADRKLKELLESGKKITKNLIDEIKVGNYKLNLEIWNKTNNKIFQFKYNEIKEIKRKPKKNKHHYYICHINLSSENENINGDNKEDYCGLDYSEDDPPESANIIEDDTKDLVISERIFIQKEDDQNEEESYQDMKDIKDEAGNDPEIEPEENKIEQINLNRNEGKIICDKRKAKSTPNRRQCEVLRKLDKRFKGTEDLEADFSIERFYSLEEQRTEFEKRRMSRNYVESQYRCEMCLKGFRERSLVVAHMKKHEKSAGMFVCRVCQMVFDTSKRHRTHRDGNHTAKYSCRRCDFVTFNKAQARSHNSWHQGIQHKCPHCDMTFRKSTTCLGHVRLAHPSRFICGSCALSFISASGLNQHRKLVHKNVQSVNSDNRTPCTECDVTFDTYRVFIKHILITKRHEDKARNIIGCKECGEQFDSTEQLSIHKHQREAAKPLSKRDIECDECGERFSHPVSRYQHYVREHPLVPYRSVRARRTYLCEQCGKTFMCRSALLTHSLRHEEGLRTPRPQPSPRPACRTCGKTVSSAANLYKHQRIHTGVKLFSCDICGKRFVDSSNLRQHVSGVHYHVRRVRKR